MVSREEVVMVGLIALMGFLLGILLLVSPKAFVGGIEGGLEAVAGTTTTEAPPTTTSTTASSTSTTSTSIPFWATITTSTTERASTTTSATSTTLRLGACDSEEDCHGGAVTEFKCKDETVYNFTTRYVCEGRGSNESRCVGRTRSNPAYRCEVWEHCRNGTCVDLFDNECDYRCNQREYDRYYCWNSPCPDGDVQVNLGEDCSVAGRYCCCYVGDAGD
jgi:hypothetical protein